MRRIIRLCIAMTFCLLLVISLTGTAVLATIVDTTPPVVTVQQSFTPGCPFYTVLATDNMDPDPEIFIIDTESGTVWGPFASGVTFKYTVAPGATPKIKPAGPPNLDWFIIGNGPGQAEAVDDYGNVAIVQL